MRDWRSASTAAGIGPTRTRPTRRPRRPGPSCSRPLQAAPSRPRCCCGSPATRWRSSRSPRRPCPTWSACAGTTLSRPKPPKDCCSAASCWPGRPDGPRTSRTPWPSSTGCWISSRTPPPVPRRASSWGAPGATRANPAAHFSSLSTPSASARMPPPLPRQCLRLLRSWTPWATCRAACACSSGCGPRPPRALRPRKPSGAPPCW